MFNLPEFWHPIIVAWLLAQFSLWWLFRTVLWAPSRIRPIAGVKSKWRRWQVGRIRLQAYLATGENDGMRRFKIKKIRAYNKKGKKIAGTIEPVHSDYWLDSGEGQGKMHLFALARQGRVLEQAHSLRLEVAAETDDGEVWKEEDVSVKVLFTDIFGPEQVTSGDYWDEVPERLRDDIQDKLADELMERAKPEIRVSLFQNQRELYPYQGVTFAVSGLGELEALFPAEQQPGELPG